MSVDFKTKNERRKVHQNSGNKTHAEARKLRKQLLNGAFGDKNLHAEVNRELMFRGTIKDAG